MNLEINKQTMQQVKEQFANAVIEVLKTENNNNLNQVSEAEINDNVHQELDEQLKTKSKKR